jgi:acetoin utilization deacetylase AcuC-like enzyme
MGAAPETGPIFAYRDEYYSDWGDHIFPSGKYGMIAKRLVEDRITESERIVAAVPAGDADLELVHAPDYLARLERLARYRGWVVPDTPVTPEILSASRIQTGGTLLACREALRRGTSANIGGGFHHAGPRTGEGFCLHNDIAIGVRRLQADGAIERALVVDLDVHQGNGTATVFTGEDRVFTFSMHQEYNYPIPKARSTLDVGLRDRTGDDEYLARLRDHLPAVFERCQPELVVYVAGADPFEEDQLGGLALTKSGLAERDRTVYAAALERGVPVCVVLAGGYARWVTDTVDIQVRSLALLVTAGSEAGFAPA